MTAPALDRDRTFIIPPSPATRLIALAAARKPGRLKLRRDGSSGLAVASVQNSGLQVVPSKGQAAWDWSVDAKEAGPQHLSLRLAAAPDFHPDARHTMETYRRDIQVEVAMGQQISGFVGPNWQWLWTVILVPVAGWLWEIWKRSG